MARATYIALSSASSGNSCRSAKTLRSMSSTLLYRTSDSSTDPSLNNSSPRSHLDCKLLKSFSPKISIFRFIVSLRRSSAPAPMESVSALCCPTLAGLVCVDDCMDTSLGAIRGASGATTGAGVTGRHLRSVTSACSFSFSRLKALISSFACFCSCCSLAFSSRASFRSASVCARLISVLYSICSATSFAFFVRAIICSW
mmetsp:Transcript_8260/g.9597  ORF Transcript_8260/g.9597 Transcript_8260/m.9597 type:complete len:200 (+) Transcript_8260:514-1113(+)